MKHFKYFIVVALVAILAGCATSLPPSELVNARLAFQQANKGQAAVLVPAELHKAKLALDQAENSFLQEPESYRTKDLSYIADRLAKTSEAEAVIIAQDAITTKANKDYETTQAEILKDKTDLLADEQKARMEAETKAAKALADLAKLAAVKEEERGLVITLSGSVLFASNKSQLLPAAQDRLNSVADALLENNGRKITIEGHTDSQGSTAYNQTLSQKRADVVRSYLISRGYPENLIIANGIGEDRPIANNDNAEGRANNRRVEIVIDRSNN
jgi:outer membrane protein OmpA-like peptidoglycan-associated protein